MGACLSLFLFPVSMKKITFGRNCLGMAQIFTVNQRVFEREDTV
jgi:hypothetical protein